MTNYQELWRAAVRQVEEKHQQQNSTYVLQPDSKTAGLILDEIVRANLFADGRDDHFKFASHEENALLQIQYEIDRNPQGRSTVSPEDYLSKGLHIEIAQVLRKNIEQQRDFELAL